MDDEYWFVNKLTFYNRSSEQKFRFIQLIEHIAVFLVGSNKLSVTQREVQAAVQNNDLSMQLSLIVNER